MKRTLLSGLIIVLLTPWMLADALADKYVRQHICPDERYLCFKVQKGDTWENLFPDEAERDIVKRVNRMNVKLRAGKTIAVPRDLDELDVLDIAPFPHRVEPTGEKTIIFSYKHHAWAAYDDDGKLVWWGPASGGKSWCADVGRGCRTIGGEFAVYTKKGKGCVSGKYPLGRGGAPMPYCMFFYRGFALHGSPIVPGHHASHGCVRLFPEDARWLNKEFIDLPNRATGTPGTRVIVDRQ